MSIDSYDSFHAICDRHIAYSRWTVVLGTRHIARRLHKRVEVLLAQNAEVGLDFPGLNMSQPFADELMGVLLLRRTATVLERLLFKGCSDSVKAVIEVVVANRYEEYGRTRSH